jgi:signal transduction histidine kinase
VSSTGDPGGSAPTADQLSAIFASAGAPLAVLRGPELVIEAANPALAALLPGTELVGLRAEAACPELGRRVAPLARRALERRTRLDLRDVRLRLPGPGGDAPRHFNLCLRPLGGAGEPSVWLALVETTAEVRARRRASLLVAFSRGLHHQRDLAPLLRRTLRRSVALLGGDHGALWLLEPDGKTVRAAHGAPHPLVRDQAFDVRALPAFKRALHAGAAAWFARDDASGAEAELFQRLGLSAGLVVPLLAGPRALGVLTVSFSGRSAPPAPDDLAFATALAAQSALALERVRALAQARRAQLAAEAAQARLRLLADVGRVLSSALDWDTAVHSVARLAVGRLADWVLLDVVEPGGGLRREAAQAAPSAASAPGWPPTLPAGARDATLDEVLQSTLVRSWEPGDAEGEARSPHLRALREAGAATALLAPLVARGEVLGVLTLARGAGARRYGEEDRGLVQDLAARVAVALHGARALRSAEHAVTARGRLVALARHEVATPLSALDLHLQRLEASEAQDARERRRLHAMRRAVARLARAVDQLVDVAYIADGELRVALEPVDLVALVREAAESLATELEAAGCPVALAAPPRLLAAADPPRVRGVVDHLLEQAARLGAGRPVDVVVSKRHGRAAMEVRWRGAPLAPQLRDALARPLERTAPELGAAEGGLGLWLSRWIVEAHGGRLLVHARPDGAAFVAELPAAAPGPAVSPSAEAPPPGAGPPRRGG